MLIGDDTAGQKDFVDVFGAGDILLGTVTMIGDGKGSTPKLVDLSAFSDVGRISIRTVTDPFGIGFGDFTFSTAAVAVAVPKSASLALVGLALAAACWTRRRTRRPVFPLR